MITDFVLQTRRELYSLRRTGLIKEGQRKAVLEWQKIPFPGAAPGFNPRWAWLRNEGVFQT